jgi:Icc protein
MANRQSSKHNADLTIVQLSDSHLRKEPEGELLGMNTRESLDAVLDLVKANHPDPDVVLATGDLAQDGHEKSYACFREKLAFFSCPVFWYTGNHDNRSAMRSATKGSNVLDKRMLTENWQLIFLDSLVPGKVYGELAEGELSYLEKALVEYPDKHTLVCFHHHPIDIESAWLDNIGLKNRASLFSIIDKYKQVKGLLWGHIHQEVDCIRKGVRMLATPSTCVQFLPKSTHFAVDTVAPGYRWLILKANGDIETGVKRAHHIEFKVDYNSKGY